MRISETRIRLTQEQLLLDGKVTVRCEGAILVLNDVDNTFALALQLEDFGLQQAEFIAPNRISGEELCLSLKSCLLGYVQMSQK